MAPLTLTPAIRPCERFCPKCERWKHHSRFRSWSRAGESDRTRPRIRFAGLCKDCEQIERNERKNADRPLALLRRRTSSHASRLGVPFDFLWINMNWRALVPILRALMSPEGLCLSCGHPFVNERDVQIEHREPPRGLDDWARQHARNLMLDCASCNGGKRDKPFSLWLDEQEEARLANEVHRATILVVATPTEQLALAI